MPHLPDEIEQLKRFHGHLGPYAVIGYRMGIIARKKFPNRIFCQVSSGTKRPLSCLADGIQFSSSCTLGKSNIKVLEKGEAKAKFSDGEMTLEIVLNDDIRKEIDSKTNKGNEEEVSMSLYSAPIKRIFIITESSSDPFSM